ncbi:MAG TPA: ABC transporter substrate-binding protein [Aggregatilinea sp.]|jgi:branched-chain amino acid transport system substrate-binding protein|uniref:ABC transporter substrate-binding protein n=1 Tax=Aggregatilinea sp. TaxID=2806333 RepID=UPI002BFC7632|nr:ABC transporter substrate-binding protein [Aggregatilinea sp.]HML20585.1 ABC transporter substrate-binding protein [Aggregatilinea sp.]
MSKRLVTLALTLVLLVGAIGPLTVAAQDDCDFSGEVVVGVIASLTGERPKVGQSTEEAAQMAADEKNAECGVQIGDENYEVVILIEDSESKAESAVAAATRLIVDEQVNAIIGPQASVEAIPAGQVANDRETPMISPWSTNPATTVDRPWVFRAAFLDPFQGPVVANFALSEFGAQTAAVLYDVASDYPKGLAENFRDAATADGIDVVAFESFTTGDTDFSSQLTNIIQQNPDVLFTPQYYNEVPLIVQQARSLGYEGPILGSDSWGTPDLIDLCGDACNGLFFSTHYAPDIATEVGQTFIGNYEELYGAKPDDVAALTYDAFQLLFTAIENAQSLERADIREALANIQLFEGVTGVMSFDEQGDPIKCAVIIEITDGAFTYYDQACPAGFPPDTAAEPDMMATAEATAEAG